MCSHAADDSRTDGGELTRSMAEAARQAPSIHNTQPWTFAALPDGLAIYEDLNRALPALDPLGRLRVISCGTAVTNAALAVAQAGRQPHVDLHGSVDEPALVATVVAAAERNESPEVASSIRRRYAAIPARRAHRRLHHRDPVAAQDIEALCEAVVGEGARPVVPGPAERRRFATLLRAATRHQLEDPGFLAEVGSWIRHPDDPHRTTDGVPVASLGTTPYPADSLVQEGWDLEALDELPIEDDLEASTVLAIATRGDTRRDWVTAGLALQRLWLEATALDLAVTFADQATQWAETRDQAAMALGAPGELQLVLRVGHPLVDVPSTPRRPLSELWR